MATRVNLSGSSVLRRSDRTAWQSFEQELVVLDVPTRTLLGLNALGAWVWDNLDGVATLGELADLVAGAYGQPIAAVQRDVLQFAESLLERGCIEPLPEHASAGLAPADE